METTPVYIGIDVSKAQLDIAERPSGERAVMAHTEASITTLVARLRHHPPACLVLEATGGLEVPLASALAVAGVPVAVVNPRQVRDFAKATGQLAKTDAIDAQILARFAESVHPVPRPLPDEATQAFSALLTRRRQLMEMCVAEQNRLQRASRPIQRQIQVHLTWLKKQLTALDKDLTHRIQSSPIWREREDLLRSVPGIGPVVSRTLLAELPEAGLSTPAGALAAAFGEGRGVGAGLGEEVAAEAEHVGPLAQPVVRGAAVLVKGCAGFGAAEAPGRGDEPADVRRGVGVAGDGGRGEPVREQADGLGGLGGVLGEVGGDVEVVDRGAVGEPAGGGGVADDPDVELAAPAQQPAGAAG